jgi:hypothetical protein
MAASPAKPSAAHFTKKRIPLPTLILKAAHCRHIPLFLSAHHGRIAPKTQPAKMPPRQGCRKAKRKPRRRQAQAGFNFAYETGLSWL